MNMIKKNAVSFHVGDAFDLILGFTDKKNERFGDL